MILVHRICKSCGRKFSFWRGTFDKPDMPTLCPDCILEGNHAH